MTMNRIEKILSDKERLNDAFKSLRKRGFVARQNYWCCQSCGWAAVGDEPKNVIFYHKQDAEAIVDGKLVGTLYVAHRFSEQSKGWEVCAELAKNGLYVNWDGSDDTRIAVINKQNFKQRRHD